MDIEKTDARARDGRGEPGWPSSSATTAVREESITPLGDERPRGRLANLNPHPLFLNRYRVIANELTQAEREFRDAGYRDLAFEASVARIAVEDLWRATRAVERAENLQAEADESS